MSTGDVSSPEVRKQSSLDDAALERLGKKPVLKRNYGFISILGFSCTVLITWEGSLVLFLTGLQNGGPSGIIYGFLLVWAGTLSVFITLSELASMAPTSGGQYHWVYMLAPPSTRKFFSYITGWLLVAGWQATTASGAYLAGTLIQGILILTHPDYLGKAQNWHGTLLFWAIILFCFIINIAVGSVLAKFEGLILFFHIAAFFGIIVSLLVLSEHADTEAVWNTFLNLGGWPTQGLSFSIGILGNVFAFIGGDGAIHMSEEIRNAAVVVPRSLLMGLAINGSLGFAMVVATLYCLQNINEAIAENPQYPFIAILHKAFNSTAGAAVAAAVIIVLGASATAGALASTSRVYWAFARDRGLPGWKSLKRVNPNTNIPTNSVITTSIIAVILSLVNIGDTTAFNGVVSIAIAALFSSYLISAGLLLYRRLTSGIRTISPDDVLTNTTGSSLTWGPWRLPGALGIANNVFSCLYLVYILFFSFWPANQHVTAQNFNYAVLVTGAVLLFSMLYYILWARKVYSGPVIEIELQLVTTRV
ncbi:amino acid transporter-like protein [Xylariaceae sp. AK1471]|nr:amino acid transporter-like protein [Xylariaceae sp. AK1471]